MEFFKILLEKFMVTKYQASKLKLFCDMFPGFKRQLDQLILVQYCLHIETTHMICIAKQLTVSLC